MEFLKSLGSAPIANLLALVGAYMILCSAAGRLVFLGGKVLFDRVGRILSAVSGMACLAAGVVLAVKIIPPPVKQVNVVASGAPFVPKAYPTDEPGELTHTSLESAPLADSMKIKRGASEERGKPEVATKAAAPPVPARSHTKSISSPAIYAEWGCEEAKQVPVSVRLPDGATYVGSQVQILEMSHAKDYSIEKAEADPSTKTVSGGVTFRGLDKVFFNCAGGGHARVVLRVEYR